MVRLFTRRTTYRANIRKARTVGYKRSPSGFKEAMRDMIDATPGMHDLMLTSLIGSLRGKKPTR